MKVGQKVNYYDPDTKDRRDAQVAKITGLGKSRAKVLTIRLGTGEDADVVENVHHARDAKGGDPFWLVKGVETAPRGWADVKEGQPVMSAQDADEQGEEAES